MTAETPSPAKAQVALDVDGVQLTISLRVDQIPVVLDEPLTATWQVTSSGSAGFVGLAADRISGRLLGMSFRASLGGTDLGLADPTPEAGAVGGPATAHDLGAGDLILPVLVDDYLELAGLVDSPAVAGETLLKLTGHWDLPIAPDDRAILAASPTPVSLTVELPLDPGS
jgi:hypothetical protein